MYKVFQYKPTFRFLFSVNKLKDYSVHAYPNTFLIDGCGKIKSICKLVNPSYVALPKTKEEFERGYLLFMAKLDESTTKKIKCIMSLDGINGYWWDDCWMRDMNKAVGNIFENGYHDGRGSVSLEIQHYGYRNFYRFPYFVFEVL